MTRRVKEFLIIAWDDEQKRWKIGMDATTDFDMANRAADSMLAMGLPFALLEVHSPR